MTIQQRPDGLIFADSAKNGEIETFPNLERGWGVTLDQTEGIPPMEWFNDLFQRQDRAIKYLMQQGISEWHKDETYPKDALTRHAGQTWQAIRENKGSIPQQGSDWGVFGNAYSKGEADDRFTRRISRVGNLVPHFGKVAPEGTLHCNGTAVSRTTYADLFKVIGTMYGIGDGVNTFNLPNVADGDAILAGNSGNVGATTVGEVISHSHTIAYQNYGYDGNKHQMGILNVGDYFYKNTSSTGGGRNLAAGVKNLICIVY